MAKQKLSSERRTNDVQNASKIYYWSIKNRKIIRLTESSFEPIHPCQCCIPIYFAKQGLVNRCPGKFRDFQQFKKHLLDSCEKQFKRPLVWCKRSEIPSDLERDREFGDLSTFSNEMEIKVDFGTKTLINSWSELLANFRQNGCPCLDAVQLKCSFKSFQKKISLLSHLSNIERKLMKYIVFKADSYETTKCLNNLFQKLSSNNLVELAPNCLENHLRLENTESSIEQSDLWYMPGQNLLSMNVLNDSVSSEIFRNEIENSDPSNRSTPLIRSNANQRISIEAVQFALTALHKSLEKVKDFEMTTTSCHLESEQNRTPLSTLNYDLTKASTSSSPFHHNIEPIYDCPENIFDSENILDNSSELIDEFFKYHSILYDLDEDILDEQFDELEPKFNDDCSPVKRFKLDLTTFQTP